MDNNNQGQQWQQPQQQQWQGQPQQQQWQQQPQQQWQQPPYNGGWQQPPRPPKKSKAGLIIGIIIAVIVLIGAGVCAYGYLMLGWFGNNAATAKASSEYEEAIKRIASEEARIQAEEESRLAEEASKEAEALKKEREESYRRLKEEWDEASRRQQSRVDEIMGRNGSSAASNSSNNNSAGTVTNPGIKVSGTWYGPVNQHTGDQSFVTFYNDGNVTLTIDMGAGETLTIFGTYTAVKNGPYEYDDVICHVTLTPGSVSTPKTFTFVIDPEVDGGKYAVFKESGFGMIRGGTTFTKG